LKIVHKEVFIGKQNIQLLLFIFLLPNLPEFLIDPFDCFEDNKKNKKKLLNTLILGGIKNTPPVGQ